ncbi:MAG: AMP-binding protein [Frankiales bacterium]|nr:AMP-binding protein [Frankiales bacterium]
MTPSTSAGSTDVPLLETTIGEDLRRTAARVGGREALVDVPSGRRWSYAQLDQAVDELARALVDAGLQHGDRLGIWAPNCPEWTLLQYATARAGIVLVTVNPAYRTSELAFVLQQSGCRWLVAAPSYKTSDYRAMVAEVASPALERALFLGDPEWDALLAHGRNLAQDALAAREAQLRNTDPICIQYTSGTTGFPKGATLSHRNLLNNGYFVGELCGYTENDRICLPVPFYHCFGMVMGNLGATTHGACTVIPAASFEPAATLQAVQDERCTSLYGVPTMFIAELGDPNFSSYDLSSLRTGIMAGTPCPVEVMKRVIADLHMEQVTICYGMTETSPVSTQSRRDDDLERRVSTVGTVHPHVEVQVVDPATGAVVPRGTTGEFCTRGYSVMLGYWNEPDKTAEAIDADGWMHTGDLAVMDDAGYLKIVGRIKDMVIRGGENVSPREVEEFLYAHPAVADVQVVGVPDPRYGEELCAWVKLVDGASLTEQDVREFCRGKLAHYKVPRYVVFVDDFPMTVTGKVQKFRMREATIEQLGLEGPVPTA